MKARFERTRLIAIGGLLLAGSVGFANGTRFSDFTPLAASAAAVSPAGEATPITFGNPDFQQRSIADRATQLLAGAPNSGSWDMNTVNETGPHKGRYLFTVFETGNSGVQRLDLLTGIAETIWQSPAPGRAVSFDAMFWTPWGTLITAEESWSTAPAGSTSPYGRLFELKNPTEAWGISNPLSSSSNDGAEFVHAVAVPRSSHEGIQFDKRGTCTSSTS